MRNACPFFDFLLARTNWKMEYEIDFRFSKKNEKWEMDVDIPFSIFFILTGK